LPDDHSFIHFPTPTQTVWERFLRKIGFQPTKKGKGDHVVWERPGFGMITINYHGKELDPNSFKSALRTLGISRKDFDQAGPGKEIPQRLRARLQEHNHHPIFA
jgi:predicted RNA binding protein YcfA (HicA-like mRNA interferase family)